MCCSSRVLTYQAVGVTFTVLGVFITCSQRGWESEIPCRNPALASVAEPSFEQDRDVLMKVLSNHSGSAAF